MSDEEAGAIEIDLLNLKNPVKAFLMQSVELEQQEVEKANLVNLVKQKNDELI